MNATSTPRRWLIAITAAMILLAPGGCATRRPATPTPGAGPDERFVIEHRVGTGETLDRIADNYYGDPGRLEDIVRENGLQATAQVVPGSVLRLRFDENEWGEARRRAAALASYNKGVELMSQDKLGEAERQFTSALDTAPGLLSARYNLALVHLRRGRADRALTLLADLTTRRPDDTAFLFAHGNALFQGARFEEAIVQFERAVALDPEFKRAAFGLARSLQEAERNREAIAAWQHYLTLDSDSGWARTARENLDKLRDAARP